MPLDIEKVIKSSPAVQKQPSEMFYKKNFLKNFAMLPQPATILKKRILQNFLEYIFTEHLRTTAFDSTLFDLRIVMSL